MILDPPKRTLPTMATEFFVVDRNVQIHPAHDRWMMGDRFGTITKVEPERVRVKLHVSGKSLWFKRDDVLHPGNWNP